MRVVVTAEGESIDSDVSDDFGHAPFILVVDTDTYDYHVIENEFADSPEGAGVAVAKAITTLEPDAVLAGGIGTHGLDILRKANIFVSYDEEGTVYNCVFDFVRRHANRRAA
jgi:predicted Fe-Mo cluster-binding NifX family protein